MKQLNRNVHRILIAEPEEGVRRQLSHALRDVYDVREAKDSASALHLLEDEREWPDALITDLELEGGSGLNLMVQAHSVDPHLPVLVVAPPQRLERALEALRLGARDCLVKPLDSIDMVRYSIERAIEERSIPLEQERLKSELRVAQRIKDRLLHLVSEDFQQMLDEFNAYSRALEENRDDAERLLAGARHTARWMTLRAEQVAIYGEIEKFPPKLHPARLSIAPSVEQAQKRVPYDPALHRIEIQERMPQVVGDPLRLCQVFENLLCNAVQYSPSGGPVRVSARRAADMVECSVADAGGPIPANLLPRVFEPFARQGRAKIPGVHSTGLGLPIARSLIESLGGRLWVDNTENGAAFTFTLHPASA